MLGGLVLQVVTMSVFMSLVGHYFWLVWQCSKTGAHKLKKKYATVRQTSYFKCVLFSICAAIVLIYVRSVYRVAEMSQGWGSKIMNNETLFLILDSAMCILAVILLTLFYVGWSFKQKKMIDAEVHSVDIENYIAISKSSQ
ncbi:unnamed protein product [Ambrosiozyma monospora]|uniref:Unnamed protein product n=1 Tax=Ambrosiozyma monospora TaxID=43982 RepID=A0ACB5U4L7_AMBMO|nr:unnamed protein product [Ambrosiozyma monospora]